MTIWLKFCHVQHMRFGIRDVPRAKALLSETMPSSPTFVVCTIILPTVRLPLPLCLCRRRSLQIYCTHMTLIILTHGDVDVTLLVDGVKNSAGAHHMVLIPLSIYLVLRTVENSAPNRWNDNIALFKPIFATRLPITLCLRSNSQPEVSLPSVSSLFSVCSKHSHPPSTHAGQPSITLMCVLRHVRDRRHRARRP